MNSGQRLLAVVSLGVLVAAPAGGTGSVPPASEGAAWQIIELPSGRPLQSARADILQRPAPPGSIVKLATLIAALESGTIRPSTRIPCNGTSRSAAGRVTCVHPRVRRPLGPAEALAYSCNVYFAAVGERLSRVRLDGVLTSLGLPPTPPSVPMALAATGVEGASAPPAAWLRALQQVLADPPGVPMHSPTRAVVREGLRGATLYGTAAAFAAHGIEALAKTGTAMTSGGHQQGAVVAAWPAGRPVRAAIVLVPGGTGADAAAFAARLASGNQPAAGPPEPRSAPMPDRPSAAATPAAPPPATLAAAQRLVRVGTPTTDGSFTVRTYPLEEYVSRVLAGEAAPRSAAAALEALAITARTFAVANGRRHARAGFDLCDLTHCQVLREPYPAVRAAAAATAGQVLIWRGAPASVYYTASCGGQTERPSSVWRGADDPPYLPRRADSGCGGQPRWTADIDAKDLERALRAAGWRGDRLRDLRVHARTGSGRVGVLSLRGMTPAEISGQDFRMAVGRALGWQLVKSTDFTLSRTGGGYRFSGRGFGHGVGFCVIGAARRAGGGESRASLLQIYFPGTAVAALDAVAPGATEKPRRAALDDAPALASGEAAAADAPPSTKPITTIALRLPEGDAGERASIQALLDSTVTRVARRLGTRPAPVEVVFHPSVESFRRVTGEPWWSVARTVGRRIDVQPLNVLRRRGMLERTLAHEIGHVLAEPKLRGRAAWVREGAALFAAGLISEADVTAARSARQPRCPSDDDLWAAVSAAAAGQAYEDARACFARALADGTAWHEVR